MDKWINKVWYAHTMGYYSALKRNEVLTHATTWMNLENMMLCEKSHTRKASYCMIPWNVQSGIDFQGLGGRSDGEWLLMSIRFLSGVIKNVLEIENDGCTTLWIYQNHWTVHFKGVNCIVYELYLNKGGVNWRVQAHWVVRLLPATGQRTPEETASGWHWWLNCLKTLRFI